MGCDTILVSYRITDNGSIEGEMVNRCIIVYDDKNRSETNMSEFDKIIDKDTFINLTCLDCGEKFIMNIKKCDNEERLFCPFCGNLNYYTLKSKKTKGELLLGGYSEFINDCITKDCKKVLQKYGIQKYDTNCQEILSCSECRQLVLRKLIKNYDIK